MQFMPQRVATICLQGLLHIEGPEFIQGPQEMKCSTVWEQSQPAGCRMSCYFLPCLFLPPTPSQKKKIQEREEACWRQKVRIWTLCGLTGLSKGWRRNNRAVSPPPRKDGKRPAITRKRVAITLDILVRERVIQSISFDLFSIPHVVC